VCFFIKGILNKKKRTKKAKNVMRYAGIASAFELLKGTAANGNKTSAHPKSSRVESVFSLYSLTALQLINIS
jgi:hypothetical protein